MAVSEILDKISSLTVTELHELVKALEEKYGVTAAAPVAMAAISARSCPEVKALPRPVSTTAPTASSASASRRAAVTSRYIAVSKALRTSGRLKATRRTPGATSPVSMRFTGALAGRDLGPIPGPQHHPLAQ